MIEVRPGQLRDLGAVQQGSPVLTELARTFHLPAEREAAEQAVEILVASIERIARVHTFARGMGYRRPSEVTHSSAQPAGQSGSYRPARSSAAR
ncbi:hypothetical protein [Streptomyces sp. NPDC004976]